MGLLNVGHLAACLDHEDASSFQGTETPSPLNDRVRFCQQCQLHVYNLSAMNTAEARALVAKSEGRLCARMYRRADGSVITQDCPVGVAALRRRTGRALAACLAVGMFLMANIATAVVGVRVLKWLPGGRSLTTTNAASSVRSLLGQPMTPPEVVMGDICLPTTPPPPIAAPPGS
jgi:hypothetical protein